MIDALVAVADIDARLILVLTVEFGEPEGSHPSLRDSSYCRFCHATLSDDELAS
jgi:hypothetical protein